MKRTISLLSILSSALFLAAAQATAGILVQDSFSGATVNSGGTGWQPWSNWNGSVIFGSNLSFGTLQTSGQAMINTDQYGGVSREFPSISSGTVWFSWVQSNNAATNVAARVNIMKEGATKFRIGQKKDETDTSFHIYDSSGLSVVNTGVSNNGTHMVAGSINLDTGEVTLYIDPTGLGLGAAPSSAATASYTFAAMQIGEFSLTTGDSNFVFDEVRVGESWADVSPTGAADTTPPSWTSGFPKADTATTEGFTPRLQINEGGTGYYVVVANNATAPSVAQVKAGHDSSSSGALRAGNLPLVSNAENSSVVTGLSAATAFDVYFVATDSAGNNQSSTTLVEISTIADSSNGLVTFRMANGLASDGSQDLTTPAADGVSNLQKYAFNMIGGETGQAATLSVPNVSVLAASDTAGLPRVGRESGTGKLQLTYIRRKVISNPGITYSVQFSNNLGISDPWAANPSASESMVPLDATFERVTLTDSSAASTARFARVMVSGL